MQTGLATIENMEVSKKFKVKLSYDSAVLLLDIYQKRKKEKENQNSKRYMHSNVYCSIIYNNQHIETT